jgi:hypothetical protein
MDRKQITASIAGAGLVAASLFGASVATSGSGDVSVVQGPPTVIATSEVPASTVEITTVDAVEPSAQDAGVVSTPYVAAEEYEEYEEEDHDEYEEDEEEDHDEEYEDDDD